MAGDDRRWFLARGKEKLGPLDHVQLRELACAGRMTPLDVLLPEDDSRWISATDVPGLFAAASQPTVEAAQRTLTFTGDHAATSVPACWCMTPSAEGVPVQDAPFVVKGREAVPTRDGSTRLVNGDLEESQESASPASLRDEPGKPSFADRLGGRKPSRFSCSAQRLDKHQEAIALLSRFEAWHRTQKDPACQEQVFWDILLREARALIQPAAMQKVGPDG